MRLGHASQSEVRLAKLFQATIGEECRGEAQVDADLVLIHGFWSSPATWDRLIYRMRDDPDLVGLRIHAFGYESPKLRWPGSPVRIPD
jgi:pimeloyl-ACP methyl ester carboxylesterase